MITIHNVPVKEPIVHRLRGKVDLSLDGRELSVGGFELPGSIAKKFLRRTDGMIWDYAVKHKDFLIRGAPRPHGYVNWFGLTSGEFLPIHLADVAPVFEVTLGKPDIRYNQHNERFVLNYKVGDLPGCSRDSASLNVTLDSGDFGVYGGNGECTARAGVSVYDKVCANWTLFFNVKHGKKRYIHRFSETDLGSMIDELVDMAADVAGHWDRSMDDFYPREVVEKYLRDYGARLGAKRIFANVLDQTGNRISAYDLAWKVTREAQGVADSTRRKLEMLAGELILCSNEIKAEYKS